jgi:sugar/nucleoside kinase (ribokinase family)
MDLVLDIVPGALSHFSLIIVDQATGSRTILWDRDPRLDYKQDSLQLNRLLEAQILLLDTNDPAAAVTVAGEARKVGIPSVLDADRVTGESEQLLSLVQVAIPSVGFVRDFAGVSDWRVGLEKISLICPGVVGVTLGEEGSAVMWENEIFEFPSFSVEVVDSTAAGDVFHGAFAFAFLQGWSLGRSMRFSNAAGALACRHLGARPSIPALEDVLERERTGSP